MTRQVDEVTTKILRRLLIDVWTRTSLLGFAATSIAPEGRANPGTGARDESGRFEECLLLDSRGSESSFRGPDSAKDQLLTNSLWGASLQHAGAIGARVVRVRPVAAGTNLQKLAYGTACLRARLSNDFRATTVREWLRELLQPGTSQLCARVVAARSTTAGSTVIPNTIASSAMQQRLPPIPAMIF